MLIYVSVGKRVLWASLYEWVLANISNKVRNKNGQIGFANVLIKPHVMWLLYRNFILSQLFSNLVYYNLYMQIWEVHISTLKWNEMKNLLQNTEREREREREKYLQMGLWWQSGRLRCETILGRRTRDGNHKQILKKTVPSLPYSSSELPILQEKWSRYIKHFHLHIS